MCNKLLCLLMLVFVIGGVVVAGTSEPNLVAWYRFDDGSGTTASDLSGNDYDATVSSSSNWSSDDYGYCLANCSSSGNLYVDVPDDVFSTMSKQVTISMWIWNPDADYLMGNLIKADAPSQNKDKILSMGIYDNGSTPASYYFTSTAGEDSSGSSDTQWWWGYNNYYSSDLEQWHHVAMVKDCDAEIEKLYYDGEEVKSYTCDSDKTMADIENCRIFTRLASGTNNSWDCYHGKIADVKIFDRAISAAEISEQAGNNLVAWWKFEETSGTIAHDSGACRYDGTLGNNNSWDGGVVMTGDNYGASKVGFSSSDVDDMFSTVDDQISIAFWAKNDFDHDSGCNRIFTGKNSSGTVILQAEWPTGTNRNLNFKAGIDDHITFYGADDPTSNNFIEMDGWHHYVLVKDADHSRMWIYMDGYKLEEITNRYSWEGGASLTASMAGIESFEICGSSANWSQFAGTIKDFRIYDTALEPLDVRDIYNQYEVEFNNTYYFDSVNGSDNNNGTSPATAWKSVSKFNATTFQPLDRILFKAGCTWSGKFYAKGSGNPGEPIVIDAYGDISNKNNKPRFDTTITSGATIAFNNVQWWEVNNLHITHHPAARTRWISAVRITADNCGKMNHIYIKDCYIHDVYGMLEVYGGGMGVTLGCNESGATESWLNDILIEGCYFETIDSTGFLGGSNGADGDRQPATNVVIRDNFFTDIGESPIVVICHEGALVEYNVITNSLGRGNGGCGIWPFASNDTIVQYNEVYGLIDNGDGEAYDCDYQCDGTIFQYNYSHDNPGGFMRICCNAGDDNYNTNNIIRYNISINDGDHDDAVIELWKKVENTQIYNNIIYLDSTKGTVDLVSSNKYGGGDGATHNWWNNIFYVESGSTGRFAIDDGSTNYWSYNCFYGSMKVGYVLDLLFEKYWIFNNGTPGDSHKITSDPKLVDPGEHAIGSSLTGYQLQSTSPCIGTGLNISNTYNGGLDYWGNHLYNGNADRGAHERQ